MKLVKISILLLIFLTSACPQGGGEIVIACGGASNLSCPTSMYCELGDLCGGIDKVGTCAPRPLNCPVDEVKEVCGCDKQTYQTACWANIKEVTVHYQGACK